MNLRTSSLLLGAWTALASVLTATAAGAAEVRIGTGDRSGIYYWVGRGMCHLIKKSEAQHGIGCDAQSTAGSIANLDGIRNGSLELGVVQSDWQYHAVSGTDRYAESGPDAELRSLFSMHGESFTVLAREDSGIERFDDLEGKRVNIGNPGSGQRATMEVVMAAKGWDKRVFSLANELPASQQSIALCHDRIQALIFMVGHPNGSVTHATNLCDARVVEVSGPEIDKLVGDSPYYSYTQVPGGIYPGSPEPVSTFGVRATVMASSRLDAEVVYGVVKAVFDSLDELKRIHPAFSVLDARRMITDGLTAPLHDGAVRYYQERGWL